MTKELDKYLNRYKYTFMHQIDEYAKELAQEKLSSEEYEKVYEDYLDEKYRDNFSKTYSEEDLEYFKEQSNKDYCQAYIEALYYEKNRKECLEIIDFLKIKH